MVTDSLEMPSLDNRAYRVIQLPNELEALLVHDPDTDMASASLDVGVGSLSDDSDIPGLAHAVEHLLFMGSEKYPKENAFDQYITSNSGYSNASTSSTSTNYYFTVSANPSNPSEAASADNPSALHRALDFLAQFVISPLFLTSSLDRELCVVDLEHSKNRQNDDWRLWQLKKELSDPGHPFHKFGTGNLDTLKVQPELRNISIRDRMIGFYEDHYSANRMKLAVLSSEPLDVLEAWVVDLFSPVSNKMLPPLRWQEVDPFGPDQLGMLCFAKPVKDLRELDLTFPIIDEWDLFESNPSSYISHLIGHEGPGSILSYIKSKGWANSLEASRYSLCAGSPGLFSCVIKLTEEGLDCYWEVIMTFFQYLSLLSDAPAQEWIYDEKKCIKDIDFRFKQKSRPIDFMKEASRCMQKPIPRAWLLSHEKLRKFDPKRIRSCLDCLRPENVLITVVSRNITDKWDRREKWYQTEYSVMAIPANRMAEMKTAFSASERDRITALRLPPTNKFIPTSFKVEKTPVVELAIAPRIIRNNDLARAWFKKDDMFWVPKASLTMIFRSPITSPADAAKSRLFIDLVLDGLTECLYDATLAGFQYSLNMDPRGLVLKVSGYNDKLPTLLKHVLVQMRDQNIKDRFAICKERLNRHYHNILRESPWNQLYSFIHWLMTEDYHAAELLAQLPSITAEATAQFRSELLSRMHMEMLIHGNIYKEEALKLTDMFESILRPQVLAKSELHTLQSMILPTGSSYIFEDVLKDPANVNHGLAFCLYIGHWADHTLRPQARMLAQIIGEPVFNQLRTKEQLSYNTGSGIQRSYASMSFLIRVQSERHPQHVDGRIEIFLASFAQTLADMSQADFETHKRSLIAARLEKIKNLEQETERLWGHIDLEDFEFDDAQQDAAGIEHLTKDDMLKFYAHYIDPRSPTRAKLSVRLLAHGRPDTAPVTEEGVTAVARALPEELPDEQPVPGNGTTPVLIRDVSEFKAWLSRAPNAGDFCNLREYELGTEAN
ncbi:peptidase M16 inactive domain-containing protein [Thozetella sp. PMI_491]|nr:peptidase M16 inactive domain-containing protein [Thozetella sp. PMI_491]